jgi:predicted DNA-binding antitoxin AbrB/MazE fold protein
MGLTVIAVYEDGVLKPDQPLPLREHEKVHVTIDTAVDAVRRSAGLLGWTGDAETVERIALDDEFGLMEAP